MSDLKTEDGPAEVPGRKKCEHCQQYGHAGDWAALEEYTGNTADLLRKVCVIMSRLAWPDIREEPVCDPPSEHGIFDQVPGLREWYEANRET